MASVNVTGIALSDTLRKGLITGGVAAAGGALLFGETGATTFFGQAVPVPVALFAANAASSMLADVAHTYLLPSIPGNEKFSNVEAAALGLGVSGASSAYILNGNLGTAESMNSALLGAGSYAAGEWIDNRFFGGSSQTLGWY